MTDFTERFVHAITFCLAAEYSSSASANDFQEAAKWALSLQEKAPSAEQQAWTIALVSGGATKIKAYVFESARLPEIRGASGLLDRVNLLDVPSLWGVDPAWDNSQKAQAEEVRKQFQARTGKLPLDCRDCVIYSNGGEILALAPLRLAADLADEIEIIYARETLVAQSVAVWKEFTLKQVRDGLNAEEALTDEQTALVKQLVGHNPAENKTFGSLVAPLALAKFRRREANHDDGSSLALRAVAHFETVPFARRCSSCERRGAVVNARVRDEDRPLCEPCARKRIYGQLAKREDADKEWWHKAHFTWQTGPTKAWTTHFEEWLGKNTELKAKYAPDVRIRSAKDLEEIGQLSEPDGFIGVVYADGNNMGQLIETLLKTPMLYSMFAESVFHAMQGAVFEALAVQLRRNFIERERTGVHPFEILSIGGDDLFLIVPAHAALPVACHIAKSVEEKLVCDPLFEHLGGYEWAKVQRCQGVTADRQCRVSLSVGVVLADAHTPVFYLEELASQLLKSAKRRAKWLKRERDYYGGTVDFLALKSVTMISSTVDDFRRASLTPEHGRLYARPYTIAELEALLKSVEALKASNFPRSQLYRLRESLRKSREQSTVDYLYFTSQDERVRPKRGEIEQLWTSNRQPVPHPWCRQLEAPKAWETIWYDLVELWDFVSGEEGHAERRD